MDPNKVPAYRIVEERVKEVNREAIITDVIYDSEHMRYIFELSDGDRISKIIFTRDFLDDSNDYSGSKASSYWKTMMMQLTSMLIESMEKAGLISYTKEYLKKSIFEYVKKALEKQDHVNKFNLIGRPYQSGGLEDFLKVKFSDNERAEAGRAFDELKSQGILVPTYKDLINPEDWVRLGEIKIKTEETKMGKRKPKAFISYSNLDNDTGVKIQEMLADFDIEGFLAHKDINVSEEWKERIINELKEMHIFIPIISDNFKQSDWAPQEAGIAYFRDEVLIIPLCLGTTIPFGFINHIQGKSIDRLYINDLIKPIVDKFPEHMIEKVIMEMEKVGNFRYAEAIMELLVPHFNKFKQEDIDKFVDFSIKNGQIWSAQKCRDEYLPMFIEINGGRINPKELKVLSHQIESDERYREK